MVKQTILSAVELNNFAGFRLGGGELLAIYQKLVTLVHIVDTRCAVTKFGIRITVILF